MGLIVIIKRLVFKFENNKYLADYMYMRSKQFYGYYQHNNMRQDDQLNNFTSYNEVVKQCGGQVGQYYILIYQNLREAVLDNFMASGSQINISTDQSEE